MALDRDDPAIAAPVRPLWRNRDFILLWSDQTVSTLGTSMSLLALPLLALALTRSPAQAGFLAAVQSLPYLVFSLPAGALIDRWDRKRVMIRCDAARFIVYGSVPLAYVLGHLTIAQLYLVALVGGTAFVFFNIAEVASLPRVVPEARLAQANAINAAAESGAQLVGPGLSGFIISLARTTASGASVAYLADSVSYLASVISLFFIAAPFQHERPAAQTRSLRAEIAEGIRFLWTRRPLRIVSLRRGGGLVNRAAAQDTPALRSDHRRVGRVASARAARARGGHFATDAGDRRGHPDHDGPDLQCRGHLISAGADVGRVAGPGQQRGTLARFRQHPAWDSSRGRSPCFDRPTRRALGSHYRDGANRPHGWVIGGPARIGNVLRR